MFEGVTAALALLSICTYILGLITVNAHLASIGMTDFGLLRARYVYAGALVSVFILICSLYTLLFWWLTVEGIPRLLTLGGLLGISAILTFLVGILAPLTRPRDTSQPAERPWWSRWSPMFFIVRFVLFYAAIALGFLTGALSFVLWIIARKEPLAAEQVPNFVEPLYFDTWLRGWDNGLQDVERWMWFAFGSFVFSVIFVVFFLIYVKTYYPHIPETLGGGSPKSAQLLIAPEGLEGARQLGIPMPECTTADNKAQLSEEVSILFEGEQVYALRLPNNEVIQIDKKLIVGARLMLRTRPLKQSLARAPQSQES